MNLARQLGATDADAIRAVVAAIADAHRTRDAAAIVRHYAPDARVADLAPPLMRSGRDPGQVQAWLDGWGGPVEIDTRDLHVEVAGDLALAHGLQQTRTRTRDGEQAAWWSRITVGFARTPAGWRITHEHVSVPFHMDGSYRAAVDLEP